MADWKLEQLNVEHSRIDTLAEGESGDGLVWLLTLTNDADVFIFASAPAMWTALTDLVEVFDREGGLDTAPELRTRMAAARGVLARAAAVPK